MVDAPDSVTTTGKEEQAKGNLTAMSVFYGFLFVFTSSLSNLAIYIGDSRPDLGFAFFVFLILVGLAQTALGYGLYREAKEAGVSKILLNGLYGFVVVTPMFYTLFLSQVVLVPNQLFIIGVVAYMVGLIIVLYLSSRSDHWDGKEGRQQAQGSTGHS